jgi:hypothetical protein
MGYRIYDRPLWLIVFVSFLGWIHAAWMPLRMKRPSQIMYWFLYVMVVLPASVAIKHGVTLPDGEVLVVVLVMFITFLMMGLIYYFPVVSLPRIQLSWSQYWILFAAIALVFYVYVVQVLGFSLRFISFYDVYDVRDEFKAAAQEAGGTVTYAVIWIGNVIGPMLITYGFMKKKYAYFGLGILSQVFIYSLTGFKSVILAGVLVIAMFIALQKRGRVLGPMMITGASGLVTLAIFLAQWTGITFIAYLSVGRLLLLPGLMTGYYYQFFSTHPKAMMGDSILSPLVDYPYSVQPQYLIGATYFNNPETQANANVWADGFAQFGISGMFFFSAVLAGVMLLYDSASRQTNKIYAAVLLGIPAITLANNPVETSLLTHGILLLLLLVYLVPSHRFKYV